VLVPTLTVTENILLVLQRSGMLMDTAAIAEKIRQLSDEFGFDIKPEEVIWKLPIGMQ
jgi:simple sugar transport system ATP-binding protein